jgi:hypothetical protein
MLHLNRGPALPWLCAIALAVLGAPRPARAADYPIRSVVDNTAPFTVLAPPVIGDTGSVYFPGRLPGLNGTADHFIYQTQGGVTTPLTETPLNETGLITNLSTNRVGQLGALGHPRNVAQVFVFDPDGVRRQMTPTGAYVAVTSAPMINDAGDASFVATTFSMAAPAIYNGSNPARDLVYGGDGRNAPVIQSIGREGLPLFFADKPHNGTDYHPAVFNGGDLLADLVFDAGNYVNLKDFRENAKGQFLFIASNPGQRPRLFTGPNPDTDQVPDDGAPVIPLRSFFGDDGQIVVYGKTLDGNNALFAGPDQSDKIIAVGDPLFGSTLTVLTLDPGLGVLNNHGEATFAYTLASGATGIAVVKLPEPGSLAVAALATVALLRRRRVRATLH